MKVTISIILMVCFTLVILLYCFLAYKKLKNILDIISNIVFFTIPIIIAILGLITIYFMITFDFCNSIHSSIYKDHFPIYNKGVGKFSNCFDSVIILIIFFLFYF